MLNTKSVKHNYKSFLFVPDDVLEVAEIVCLKANLPRTKAHPFTICVRVLEVWKDARLKELDAAGLDEKDLTEEMLWLDVEWPHMSHFALRFFGASGLQKIFPVVMDAGFARQRYIKCNAKTGARICHENGAPLVYATYQEAKDDKAYHGRIIHQALFLSEALNEAIAALGRPPSPDNTPPPKPEPEPEEKGEGTQREQTGSLGSAENSSPRDTTVQAGNMHTGGISERNIPSPSPKCEGVNSQIPHEYYAGVTSSPECEGGETSASTPGPAAKGGSHPRQDPSQNRKEPVRQSANHKDSKSKESLKIPAEKGITLTSGPAAVISHFDFFREFTPEAVLDLAHLILPLPSVYASPERQVAAEAAMVQAANKLAENGFLRERGLIHLARLLYYFADETSPCKHREHLRQRNPGVQMRLWMLTDVVVNIASKEMEACNWFPPELPAASSCPTHEPPPMSGYEIDFARLRGVPRAKIAGMDQQTALALSGYLREQLFPAEQFPEIYVDYGCIDRFQRDCGHYIEFWWKPEHLIRCYSPEEWYLIEDHAELLDTPRELAHRLAQICRAQVA